MHIIYTYHHHQRWISNECDYTNVPTIISNSKTIRVKKIYFYTENKRKERNCWTRFLFYPRANSRMITRWSRERRLARNEIQPPTTFACGRKRKKKGREGEGDRDESIRAWRETETVNYRTGTRQSREPVGRTSSRINRAKSIVRYYYTCWKGWTVERKKKKKKKKKETRAIKKTGFRLEIKLFIVSPFRGHCGETSNKIRLIGRKSSPDSLCFISDDDLTRFRNLFRISSFFFRSFFFNFFFSFFLFLSFFFLYYTTPSGVDRKYSV